MTLTHTLYGLHHLSEPYCAFTRSESRVVPLVHDGGHHSGESYHFKGAAADAQHAQALLDRWMQLPNAPIGRLTTNPETGEASLALACIRTDGQALSPLVDAVVLLPRGRP